MRSGRITSTSTADDQLAIKDLIEPLLLILGRRPWARWRHVVSARLVVADRSEPGQARRRLRGCDMLGPTRRQIGQDFEGRASGGCIRGRQQADQEKARSGGADRACPGRKAEHGGTSLSEAQGEQLLWRPQLLRGCGPLNAARSRKHARSSQPARGHVVSIASTCAVGWSGREHNFELRATAAV